jgi:imidazolonepropionase-like amidohydrolase
VPTGTVAVRRGRVLWLSDGMVREIGAADDVVDDYEIFVTGGSFVTPSLLVESEEALERW